MNRTFKAAVAALIFAVGFAGSAAAGPFEDAVVALKKNDYAMALWLLRPLAEQGDAQSQAALGLMYYDGRGVPQNYVLAHMWLSLALRGEKLAAKARDMVAAKMTPAQIAEAQKLARQWRPTGPRFRLLSESFDS
jgi:TPR repeat protein